MFLLLRNHWNEQNVVYCLLGVVLQIFRFCRKALIDGLFQGIYTSHSAFYKLDLTHEDPG
jgi:hypothetical protein